MGLANRAGVDGGSEWPSLVHDLVVSLPLPHSLTHSLSHSDC
jgi:hypothetical protein